MYVIAVEQGGRKVYWLGANPRFVTERRRAAQFMSIGNAEQVARRLKAELKVPVEVIRLRGSR
ncbi:MAG: hypothetical protein ACREVE_15525 [Gammaproteobacteria bacterium]